MKELIEGYIKKLEDSAQRLDEKIKEYQLIINDLHGKHHNHEASKKQDDLIELISRKRDVDYEIMKQKYLLEKEVNKQA